MDQQRYSRYAEKKAGANNKFYEVEAEPQDDGTFRVVFRWGRIGTLGQEKQQCITAHYDYAVRLCDEQFAAKQKRGYVEVNAMEALASAAQDVSEREVNGLEPVEIETPKFHAGTSEKRCQQFCSKYLDKLNVIRKDKRTLGMDHYERQIEALLKSYCKEWGRILRTKAHGHLADNPAAINAMRIFFNDLVNNAGCYVSGYFEGVGVR